jgi:hypothetical protein
VNDRRLAVLSASDPDIYVEYYDCEWAPDSRRFLVNRHREYEHDDSVDASDLWLFDIAGRPCRLTHTPREEDNAAGWIDDRRIRFEAGWPGRYVIELVETPKRR